MPMGARRILKAGSKYNLFFEDNFLVDSPQLDTTKWITYTRNKGYRNNELQYYAPEQVKVAGGNMVITAEKRVDGEWYSAEVHTNSAGWRGFGYFEAKIKIPMAQGIWPAFWMIGNGAAWPNGGEVDILESINNNARCYSTVHGGGTNGHWSRSAGNTPIDTSLWHVYGVDIRPDILRFYVDNQLTGTVTSNQRPAGADWVFGTFPNRVILNIAVGGNWPGPPDGTTPASVEMLVDYVRIYT